MATESPYRPLRSPGHIRLLKLSQEGADGDSIIKCKLVATRLSLAGNLKYHALSYAWGNPGRTKSIDCDGSLINITESLFAYLSQRYSFPLQHALWRSGAPPERKTPYWYLWVDAVCINQDDPKEKAQQIGLMPQIYRNAAYTISWLGAAEMNDYQAVMDAVCDMLDRQRVMSYEVIHIGAPKEANAPLVRAAPDEKLRNARTVLLDFFSRSYFGRRWILQEVAYSKQLWYQYGPLLISESNVAIAWGAALTGERRPRYSKWDNWFGPGQVDSSARMMQQSNPTLYGQPEPPLGASEELEEKAQHMMAMIIARNMAQSMGDAVDKDGPDDLASADFFGVFRYLLLGGGYACSDPRDRIYAILNLARPSPMMPDYTVSPRECYIRFAKLVFASAPSFGGTMLLCAALSRKQGPEALEDLDLPSWVPDWRIGAGHWGWHTFMQGSSALLSPGGEQCFEVDDGKVLSVQASFFGTVAVYFPDEDSGVAMVPCYSDPGISLILYHASGLQHGDAIIKCSGYIIGLRPTNEAEDRFIVVGACTTRETELRVMTGDLAGWLEQQSTATAKIRSSAGRVTDGDPDEVDDLQPLLEGMKDLLGSLFESRDDNQFREQVKESLDRANRGGAEHHTKPPRFISKDWTSDGDAIEAKMGKRWWKII